MEEINFLNNYKYNNKMDIFGNIRRFYEQTGTNKTFIHCENVAKCAAKFSYHDNKGLQIACLLHDASAFIPTKKRLEVSEKLGINILPEEREVPLLLHQKISSYIAKQCFNITDEKVLDSIECHTTLRENFTELDLILFLADKIAWDQEGTPPYLKELLSALNKSMESAASVYINYLLNDSQLKVVHPWLNAANNQLSDDI